jgi:hypothetical protein
MKSRTIEVCWRKFDDFRPVASARQQPRVTILLQLFAQHREGAAAKTRVRASHADALSPFETHRSTMLLRMRA